MCLYQVFESFEASEALKGHNPFPSDSNYKVFMLPEYAARILAINGNSLINISLVLYYLKICD